MAVIPRERETVPRPARRRSGIAKGDGQVTGNGGKGDEGLYEGPMVYKLLTWHRPKKGEQEEKEDKEEEEEEKEIGEKGR